MPNENNYPNQIIVVINAECKQISVSLSIPLSNEVNPIQQHNAIQDQQSDNYEERISFLEAEILNLRHIVHQKEDLENRLAFFEPQD